MSTKKVEIPKHHVKEKICATRKPYREGRHAKAVKVYTVNNESRYILIQDVPSVGATQNLVNLCSKFGEVDEHHALDEYPCEDKYTEVYLFKFKKIQSARFAKRKLDDYSFFGGALHVCYAPEHETVAETREKLQERRRIIASKIRRNEAALQTASKSMLTSTNATEPKGTQAVVAAETQSSSNFAFSYSKWNHHNQIRSAPDPAAQDFRVPPPNISELDTISENLSDVQTLNTEPAQNFTIPLPPPASIFVPLSVRGRSNYEFSRVPSAHATLSAGYDCCFKPKIETTNITRPYQDFQGHGISISQSPLTQSNPGVKSVKEKFDTGKAEIKVFKKSGPTPKFVPRQAVKRKAVDSQRMGKIVDQLDHEIRHNAFHLGKVHGPENHEKADKGPAVPPAVDKSVRETIHAIRSQISEAIKNNVKKQT